MSEPTQAEAVAHLLAPLSGKRLLLLATGSLSVSMLPYWVNWIRLAGDLVDVRLVLTRSAATFVSPRALGAGLGKRVEFDDWDSHTETTAPHVEMAEWADVVLVHPCTFSFLSRFSLGLADSPTLLTLHALEVPIVLCPALPPGIEESQVYRTHLDRLKDRPHVVVMPPVEGKSSTTGKRQSGAPALFPDAIELLGRVIDGHE